jgi:hypothetical protein
MKLEFSLHDIMWTILLRAEVDVEQQWWCSINFCRFRDTPANERAFDTHPLFSLFFGYLDLHRE